ncbi:MAG: glycosyltransferase family 2 protein [Gemmatimonadaceae bacterium]
MAADTSIAEPVSQVPVTVVIATRNEEANIAACIDSVRWADEIIVADQGSSDETQAHAENAGAMVLSVVEAPTIGAGRNLAIGRARNHWILVVDADERGTTDLERAVRSTIANPAAVAYRVPRTNHFMGGEVRHGGWESDRPVRLFDSALRYNDSRVHEHVITNTEPATLTSPLLHYPYASMEIYFEKFVRYSRWWAEDQSRRGRRASVAAVIFKPPARFISMYIFRLGFLDGPRGAALAALAAASVCAKYVRLWALECES